MKHINYLSLLVVLSVLWAGSANTFALTPEAVQTNVSSIIEKMPAHDSQQCDALAKELVDMNPLATRVLASMLKPTGQTGDAGARYGIRAITNYVSQSGLETKRTAYVATLIDALASVEDKQNKAFLITQIQATGGVEAVASLATYLYDDVLCDYAARAMLTIHAGGIEQSFLNALDSATPATEATLIKALGEIQSSAAAAKINALAGSVDPAIRQSVLYALANIGDPSSEPILKEACLMGNAYEQTKNMSLYLHFAARLAETGNTELGVTICKAVRDGDGPEHIRAAAATLLDAVIMPRHTHAAALQADGSVGVNTLTDQEKADGFQLLFNGKDLTGWVGSTDSYGVKDGILFCRKNTGRNIYTENEYDNFVLRFEFKLQPGTNNGLGIRAPLEGDAAYVGMELQILDNTAEKYSNLHDWQYHGSIYGVVPAKRGYLKPVGEWNYEEVIADGHHIIVKLNGTVIVDADLKEATKDGIISNRPHPGLFNETGHIGFLGHGDYVEFRNIRLRQL